MDRALMMAECFFHGTLFRREVSMIREITLRQAGGSVTATLPKEMAERLQVRPGDRMFAIEMENGILLTPYSPDLHEAMQAFGEVRRQYRNTLKRLSELS
jgi:putative addiction module antidote